ncbi:MAG: bifunctional folylpolyglutamate synthase/dihydrofolate synthase [Methylobacteriaceae bacterium]|jgi:dihydrofolate synthase/folylpolyglutamate synthase|nr:bifunctional folylpolyglutamate synthase/dihydrofolate synthase [Methylobacteriaceae bacterium]
MDSSDTLIERLTRLHPKAIDLSLGRVLRLLAALGNPHKRLPPVIHVAGTNGKGSTIAFMRAILESAELAVHVYTSPHLVHFHERIRLGKVGGGAFVDEETLARALQRCETANAGEPITIFEITTAAAFLLFAEHHADVLLLETGLGGRLDATNVVEHPAAAVITSIGHDHPEYLGTDLAAIALEKAGIFKAGSPVVIAPQAYQQVVPVLTGAAERAKAGPIVVGKQDFAAYEQHGRFIYQDTNCLMDLPLPKLPGRHQWTNAGTAIAALRAAGFADLENEAFEHGLLTVNWPARLQSLKTGALVDSAPAGADIWVDGGHNADGARVLSAAIADLEERHAAPLFMVCGMLNTKDSAAFFQPFAGLARKVFAVPVPGNSMSRSAEETADFARRAGLTAIAVADVPEAFAAISDEVTAEPPRILVCGSLYLAGHVLALNGTPPR